MTMKRLSNAALLVQLIGSLRRHGSWCGETHVQKSVYLLQTLLSVPLDFNFILYKHGPFSFDLRDELTSLQADELVVLEPQPIPYGPKLVATSGGTSLAARFPKTLAAYRDAIEQVAAIVGQRGVNDLERLATAVFVTAKDPDLDPAQRAESLVGLKPHIAIHDAAAAIAEADRLIARTTQPL
jgi:hypothetical protein